MKYRKKPVGIEAVQYKGTIDSDREIELFVNGELGVKTGILDYDPDVNWYYLKTLEGNMYLKNGDWIIKGVKGEFYPCKPDIFEMTYEEVEE